MLKHWTYNYQDRVYSTPIINLSEVDDAQRELEYLLDNDVKVALMKPGPVKGIRGWRSPALPEFDPFWRDVEAAGLPIVLHASYPRSTTMSALGSRRTPRTSWRRARSAGWCWATARSPT